MKKGEVKEAKQERKKNIQRENGKEDIKISKRLEI